MASKENITSTDILELKHKFTQQQLDEFSALFPGLKTDTLSRFLIARGGDVAKASLLLDNHLRWRSDAANYPVLKSDAMRELAIGKLYVHGVDKEGHPLVVYRSKYVPIPFIQRFSRFTHLFPQAEYSSRERCNGDDEKRGVVAGARHTTDARRQEQGHATH